MPPNKQDEIPEYPFQAPFGGLDSEVPPSSIGNVGFAEIQNLILRNSSATIVPEFTPVFINGGDPSPDHTPIMGMFDFFDQGDIGQETDALRRSGVFTKTHMYYFFGSSWAAIPPGGPIVGAVPPAVPPPFVNMSSGQALSGGPYDFFSSTTLGYKLFFSQGVNPIQVWDPRYPTYNTADDYVPPIAQGIPGYIPAHIYPVPAKYLMELDEHLLVGNTRELPPSWVNANPGYFVLGQPHDPPPASAYSQAAPQRVHWSASQDGLDWSSFSAGQGDIFNNLGPITGMTRLFQTGYIFQQWGVTQAVPTGISQAPFNFITMGAYAKGNTLPRTLAAFGEMIAAYVGKDDIYVFDGTSSQPISQHPVDGNRRLGARTRIFHDLYTVVTGSPHGKDNIFAAIMTSANGTTFEAYWLLIPTLSKAWVYNFDESNWTQVYFQPGRLNGPIQAQFGAPEGAQALGGNQDVDAMVIADNRVMSVSYMNFDQPGFVPTLDSIGPGDGWYIRSGPLDFDDNRHTHTVNKIRIVLTDLGRCQFYIRLTNEKSEQTPLQLITTGSGTGGPITHVVDLQNGITGKYITWELSGPPGVPFQLVEFTPYPIPGGEVMSHCQVTVNPPVLPGPGPVSVTISPTDVTIDSAATQQFTSFVINALDQQVTWTVTGNGTISASGLYTAPSIDAGQTETATVTVTANADPTKSATATVTIGTGIISVTVAPSAVTLSSGQTQQFSAVVNNSPDQSVVWSSSLLGAMGPTGLFVAPPLVSSTETVTVTAMAVIDNTKTGTATVTINP